MQDDGGKVAYMHRSDLNNSENDGAPIADGTQFTGAEKAVDEFCAELGLLPLPVCDLHGSVLLRKGG